ncbi:MAG TPA: TA system VapC family ribonuclease toxin [Candidatus Angelobacter sp.]|nr:TA system VapC family ribonuclease toxin [Candidatus Angelobacter sp.]
MTHLLDVNVLLAAIWRNHPQHAQASAWLKGKTPAVCPIAELGFLRISTHRKAINARMTDARTALENFLEQNAIARVPDDLPALKSMAESSEEVTDRYLADLAQKHRLKLVTFNVGIKHGSVELIS